MANYSTQQQWGQYTHPRLQLEHEYDFNAQQQHYQFNSEQQQQYTSDTFTQRPSSYTRTSHSPSASIDGHGHLYPNSNSQSQAAFTFGAQNNNNFLSPDSEYHNNNTTPTYNFQASTTPTATGLGSMTMAQAQASNRGGTGRQYYLPRASQPGSTAQQPKGKRQRVPDPTTAEPRDDDMDGTGSGDKQDMEEEGGARAKPPGACARCKNLKVKCEFKTDTDPCKRCFNGGHECVTPGRKKRRTPPKREHLLNQIREQAAEIQKLMTQLEETNARHARAPNSATTDTFPLTPSSTSGLHSPVLSPTGNGSSVASYFSGKNDTESTSLSSEPNASSNKVVEDWLAKARDSLAEFDGFIGIGGAGMPKRYLVKEDLEDSASEEGENNYDEAVIVDDPEAMDAEESLNIDGIDDDDDPEQSGGQAGEYEIEVLDSEGRSGGSRGGKKLRQMSNTSISTNGARSPKKKDSGNEKLASLPSEASPFGLMADLSLKKGGEETPETDGSAPALGVANRDFFRSSPAPDPLRNRPLGGGPAMPHILTRGLITPQEAEKLFDIFFERMNLSVSLLDPVLYTPQKTVYRSPFLFTVVCAIASRFYTERPELYPQAMHYAQLAAGTALISGQKCIESVQGWILMSLYPVPAKRWEDERGWLYLGLAIRLAIDLNLHLPNTAQPMNELHAREMLNRTRVWLNCFNLDRSTGSQYGKAPTISNADYMGNHAEEWWQSSPYNMPNFDIHICAYGAELRVMAAFVAAIYSDPKHPTGLNKNVDFEKVAADTDEQLKRLGDKWQRMVLEQTDQTDPQNRFRGGLLKLAYSYSRLVALSFGFQHAFGKNDKDENPFLMRCLAAASDVVTVLVHDVGRPEQRIYLRHGPIAQTVFVTFAASMLVKLLQPKFASYLTTDKRQEILGLVKSVVDILGEVSIDDKHGPNLYARFLKGLLASPQAKVDGSRQRRPARTNSGQQQQHPSDDAQSVSTHASPESTTLSPPPSTAALSFDRFAPSVNGGVDPFMPLAGGDGGVLGGLDPSQADFYPPSMSTYGDPLQGMQPLSASWPEDFSWMSQIPTTDYMRPEALYTTSY